MRAAYHEQILPALDAFRPDFLLISAGFDADYRDPLAQLNWHPDDYRWVTLEAARSCRAPLRRAHCLDARRRL